MSYRTTFLAFLFVRGIIAAGFRQQCSHDKSNINTSILISSFSVPIFQAQGLWLLKHLNLLSEINIKKESQCGIGG